MNKCDTYIKLADYINESYMLGLPPHTDESGFVKVFAILLTIEEADIATLLSVNLETVEQILERACYREQEYKRNDLEKCLLSLAYKGIILIDESEADKRFKLLPFIPGIFESLIKSSNNPEVAECLQLYSEEMKQYRKSQSDRSIALDCKIDVSVMHASINEVKLYVESTNHYAVMNCICRTIQASRGNACGHPIKDMCIIIGDYAEYYIKIGNARRASKEEVFHVLKQAEDAGLFHEMYKIEKSKSAFICNCCTCGCMFLGLANRIHSVISFDSKVSISREHCLGCGKCIDTCPEQVFRFDNKGNINIDESKCFQCGLCKISCLENAITIGE